MAKNKSDIEVGAERAMGGCCAIVLLLIIAAFALFVILAFCASSG